MTDNKEKVLNEEQLEQVSGGKIDEHKASHAIIELFGDKAAGMVVSAAPIPDNTEK